MQHISYKTTGVCARTIDYDLDENGKIYNLRFEGGCNGNLKAIGKLLEGTDAMHAAEILKGNNCNGKGTSCADQLSKSIIKALEK